MKNILEQLDFSMKNLYIQSLKYNTSDPSYHKILRKLAKQFNYCKVLLALEDKNINNTFYFKYTDIEQIEILLEKYGYINKSPKTKTR